MKEIPKVSQLRTRPPRAAPPRRLAQQTRALRRARAALRNESARRRDAEERLHQAASHDALTGLPNRSLLMDRLREGVERARNRPDHLLALLFVDIDNFNVINDSLGHRFGDDLLIEAAQRLVCGLQSLNARLRPAHSLAARLGGDDFVILLDGLRSHSDAVAIAEHVQQHLAPLFSLGGREVGIGTSIGIALGGAGCQDASALLRSADTALFRAKLAGKARHAVFDERMHAETLQRFELENALRAALDRQQLAILYQPIVALDTGRIRS
ncbi:MAG TPA: diguanylate cyclase, partial [Phycisphaerae bacterium]